MMETPAERQGFGHSPVLLPGVGSHWPALRLWQGPSGLSRLKELCGGARIQVMISREDRFVGDMQHLMLLECAFADFLDGRLELSRPPPPPEEEEQRQAPAALVEEGEADPAGLPHPAHHHRLYAYLAQCPIGMPSADGQGLQPGPLHGLMADLELPEPLQRVRVSQINFWASPRPTQSSLHYDPYQNLLVVAAGSKTVRLVPPDVTPLLAPQPIYHESANHSPADLAAPDLARFPGLARALLQLQTFTLQPGDGLFIPEGWWHQVESGAGTLAVNFWWESEVSRALGGAADRYYFRRLAQSLLEREKRRLLASVQPLDLAQLALALTQQERQQGQGQPAGPVAHPSGGAEGPAGWLEAGGAGLSAREEAALQALSSLAVVAEGAEGSADVAGAAELAGAPRGSGGSGHSVLHHAQRQVEGLLAALAAERAEQPIEAGAAAAAAAGGSEIGGRGGPYMEVEGAAAAGDAEGASATGMRQAAAAAAPAAPQCCSGPRGKPPGGPPVASPPACAEPLVRVLLALRERQPAALRWLLLEGLSPLGWELLLGRLEAAEEAAAEATDPQAAQDRFAAFYDRLYSVVEDREELLDLMLARKEQCAQQALRGVLQEELGVRSVHF